MTAEVALLNKHAVALAADSAVTVGSPDVGQGKVYNAANKVFALSKYHPVGVMVFGNAEFMGVPWETVIKEYRRRLGRTSFSTLSTYYEDFLEFLSTNDAMFGQTVQSQTVRSRAVAVVRAVVDQIERQAAETIETAGAVSALEIKSFLDATLSGALPLLDHPFLHGLDADCDAKLLETFSEEISKAIDLGAESLPIDAAQRGQLAQVIIASFTRTPLGEGNSGLVIAGFGDDEHFPSLRAAFLEGRLGDRLLMEESHHTRIGVESGCQVSSIIPFAQIDAVKLFVEGIDPGYDKLARSFVRESLRELSDQMVSFLGLPQVEAEKLRMLWRGVGDEVFEGFVQRVATARQEQYVEPLLDVIEMLPKDELAAVAEALVNLTSLRRRMSLNAETVGGPIDVAVISKGDGLVWIRRKHYFDKSLNPQFFHNYFPPETQNVE